MSNIRKRYAKVSVIIKLFWLLNITPVCRDVILAKLLQRDCCCKLYIVEQTFRKDAFTM